MNNIVNHDIKNDLVINMAGKKFLMETTQSPSGLTPSFKDITGLYTRGDIKDLFKKYFLAGNNGLGLMVTNDVAEARTSHAMEIIGF